MKILIVSQYFWPENFRINDIASYFEEESHDVEVLTGIPNYPDGKIYEAYKKDKKHFKYFNKTKVTSLPIPPRGNNKFAIFINYLTFLVFGSLYGLIKLRKNYDIVLVFQPSPITVVIPALIISRLTNSNLVLWVLDLWPQSLQAVNILRNDSLLYKLSEKIVSWIYLNCDLVLASSMGAVELITEQTHYKNENIKYFPNWAEEYSDREDSEISNILSKDKNFKISFAGNLGKGQNLECLIKALKDALKVNNKISLYLIGTGWNMSHLKRLAHELSLTKSVHFLGRVESKYIPSILKESDVLFVGLKDDPVYNVTIPGKLPSYLMLGKPVLSSLGDEGHRIIEDSCGGFSSKPNDINSLSKNILKAASLTSSELHNIGLQGRSYALANFKKEYLLKKLQNLLKVLKLNN